MVTGKAISSQGWTGPLGSKSFQLPEFLDNRHMNEVTLSAQHSGRLYITTGTPGIHVCYRLSRSQGHRATGRIKSTKKPNNPIRNRTGARLACSAVPQPTSPCPQQEWLWCMNLNHFKVFVWCSMLKIIMVYFGDRFQPTRFQLHS
jgi:hypothetical protein